MHVSVADAKNKLPELIKAVEDGEPVTICRRGVPVVDIVRTKEPTRKKRMLGTLAGQIQVLEFVQRASRASVFYGSALSYAQYPPLAHPGGIWSRVRHPLPL